MSTMAMFNMSMSVSSVKHGNVNEGNAYKYCQSWQINYDLFTSYINKFLNTIFRLSQLIQPVLPHIKRIVNNK